VSSLSFWYVPYRGEAAIARIKGAGVVDLVLCFLLADFIVSVCVSF